MSDKRNNIVKDTKACLSWWIQTRGKKILSVNHHTMEVNPFIVPVTAALHNLVSNEEVSDFLLTGHFIGGHNTGFGKLIDEKLLPQVFGTIKLDRNSRVNLKLTAAAFNDIDHVVDTDDGRVMLSLKASKWTIQLGQAIGLNNSFKAIRSFSRDDLVDAKKIIVGTYYGKNEYLTDKYDILRGINRGAKHDVEDITDFVDVLAGKELWSWLGGDERTQDWIMEGIVEAIKENDTLIKAITGVTANMEKEFSQRFPDNIDFEDTSAWLDYLKRING